MKKETGQMEKKKQSGSGVSGVMVLITFVGFLLVFTYMSLNLKSIDFGYEMQELLVNKKQIQEEIDKLKSQKAELLNLKRVEQLVTEKLGYSYPEPEQFIKIYVKK